jgi:uncharacterized membrane protein YqgA involved in biofilm formation
VQNAESIYFYILFYGVLDLVIIMVMAAGMGKGALFSAVPVFILQFSVTLLAHVLSGLMKEAAVANLSLVGSILIFAVGVNLLRPHTFRVANLLPAVLAAAVWGFF